MDQAELEDREPDLLPHFSVHNLRHTFCTRLCESTNDVKFIQQVMGHADFSTTMDIYTHITQENMQEKDVYKRQRDSGVEQITVHHDGVRFEQRHNNGLIPVSYTHLLPKKRRDFDSGCGIRRYDTWPADTFG